MRNVGELKAGRRLQISIDLVLISTKSGFEGEVLHSLNGIKEVNLQRLWVYDVVAKIEVNSMDELRNIVAFRIRRLSMVRTTLTMYAF